MKKGSILLVLFWQCLPARKEDNFSGLETQINQQLEG
jgi:hypothetical protein